jgi:hypothetical protein
MAHQRPSERSGTANHAAKAGIGVDEAAALQGDDQMELAGAGADKRNVARAEVALRRMETAIGCNVFQPRKSVGAKRVTVGQAPRLSASRERRRQQADAIEARRGVAAMQPEFRAGKPPGCLGQQRPGHGCGCGGGG